MKNKITLCVAVMAAIFGQACSKDSENKISEIFEEHDYFTGDSTTNFKTDGKFLCDTKWTPGPANYDYAPASGNKPIIEDGKANEPWCLIPYGESTEFFITAKSDESVEDYVCRDLGAQYSLENEEKFDNIGKGKYKTHEQMMCVPIDSVVVTANSSQLEYKDDPLYHIRKIEDLYSIAGHINLRLVKPVHLNVLWEPILHGSYNINPYQTKKDWEMYMKKAGYYIDIITIPIFFPNEMESVKDDKLTLPAEKGVLSKELTGWFNGSVFNKKSELERFGAEPDLSRVKQANYTIITTEGYNFSYDAKTKFEGANGYDPDGFNACTSPSSLKNLLSMTVPGSDFSNIKGSFIGSYFDKNGRFIAFTDAEEGNVIDGYVSIPSENTKNKCENVAEVRYETIGISAFGVNNGYVLADIHFSLRKNHGRLLASLLYSAILTIPNPINGNDKTWLSSYSENTDIEQPIRFWRNYPPKRLQQQSTPFLEYTDFMQDENSVLHFLAKKSFESEPKAKKPQNEVKNAPLVNVKGARTKQGKVPTYRVK
jgi:hypothetical protein